LFKNQTKVLFSLLSNWRSNASYVLLSCQFSRHSQAYSILKLHGSALILNHNRAFLKAKPE